MKFTELNHDQKQRLIMTFFLYVVVGVAFLIYCCIEIYSDKAHAMDSWNSYLSDSPEQTAVVEEQSKEAVKVSVGTYVENLREINMKGSFYRVEFEVWFEWEGDPELDMANNFRIYKGLINKKTVLREINEGGKNYQLLSVDVTVSKNFETKRFPLDSHQMRFYVESNYPVQEVVLVPDRENSGINRNLALAGYSFLRHDIGNVSYIYDSTKGDPSLTEKAVTSEIVTAFEINRSTYGLYFKCFIALAGTIIWTLIALYICTYHHVDPLGMMPGALFGTVGNIMVGASLLPDALEMGLLEYVNLWGILIILGVTVAIININRIRNKYQDRQFAHYYGTIMFYTVLAFTLISQIVLPVLAYNRTLI